MEILRINIQNALDNPEVEIFLKRLVRARALNALSIPSNEILLNLHCRIRFEAISCDAWFVSKDVMITETTH